MKLTKQEISKRDEIYKEAGLKKIPKNPAKMFKKYRKEF